jgi:cell wall-associated NlpC family hydrolase
VTGSQRWSGIDGKVYPPNAPPYSDCSSAVTWIYWTVYGGGPDFLNGENWQAGYTGTLLQHGTQIQYSQIQPGDLVFYANPEHVTMYMGNGQVVSHGEDPVAIEAWDYRPVQEIRTYL